MQSRRVFLFLVLFVSATHLPGCAKLAIRSSPELIGHLAQSLFEECDPELARVAMPAQLKILEGLGRTDPRNRQVLTTLCMGYTGYALLFVEDDDPARASRLYLRARDYGIRAMGSKARALAQAGHSLDAARRLLSRMGPEHVDALLWTAMAWNSWIHLNLDEPAALAQLPRAQACLDRVLEIRPDAFYGVPLVLKATLMAATPALLGGDLRQAKAYFDQAVEQTSGRFFLALYYCARYYAVGAQDRELFVFLLTEIENGSPADLITACLINAVMKKKAARLMAMSQDLFL